MNFGPVILVGGLSVIGGVGYIFLEDSISGPASVETVEMASVQSELVLNDVENTAAPTAGSEVIELKPTEGAKPLIGGTTNGGQAQDSFSNTVPNSAGTTEIGSPTENQSTTEAPAQTQTIPENKNKRIKVEPSEQTEQAAQTEQTQPGAESSTSTCQLDMVATPVTDGMIDVSLLAPCFGGMQGVISAGQISFSFKLDEVGQANVTIPAMSVYVIISASLDNEQGNLAQFPFADANKYDRVALNWEGGAEFTFGETSALGNGTIWSSKEALGKYAAPEGESTKNVVVYSRPAGSGNGLESDVAIQAPLSGNNCGAKIETVMTGKLAASTEIPKKTIEFNMPACEGEPGMVAMMLPIGEQAEKLALSN